MPLNSLEKGRTHAKTSWSTWRLERDKQRSGGKRSMPRTELQFHTDRFNRDMNWVISFGKYCAQRRIGAAPRTATLTPSR
eukprot:4287797-Amphidinium_carterae.1